MEFALIAPVMIALYFGVTELSDGLIASNKMTSVASTAADLVGAGHQYLRHRNGRHLRGVERHHVSLPLNNMKIIISSVAVDSGNNVTKVAWSNAQNGTARAVNSVVTLPTGLVTSGGGGSGLSCAEVDL